MGGGHGDGHGVTYKGLTLYPPKRWHTVTGKGLCAVMWYARLDSVSFPFYNMPIIPLLSHLGFWVLYRAKQDGPVLLGWRRPWEGHEDHEDDHEHAHARCVQIFVRIGSSTPQVLEDDGLSCNKWWRGERVSDNREEGLRESVETEDDNDEEEGMSVNNRWILQREKLLSLQSQCSVQLSKRVTV
ncbi:NADH dehydrogenase ubiquinone 1 beta subcomplex subunit 2 [Nymphaea thermarum]|nr:NADH dehydrogenase ubiquinone 1 beta subcomplex subunit 2 [Nymphaea thermarum]